MRSSISRLISLALSCSVGTRSVGTRSWDQLRKVLLVTGVASVGAIPLSISIAIAVSASMTESEAERELDFFEKLSLEGKNVTIVSGDNYEGKGVVHYADGSVFRGEWREGLILKGVLTSPAGQESELWFAKNNYLYGSIKYSDGQWYSGQINPRSGLPEGQGNLYARSITRPVYEGKFLNGRFNGRGKKWVRSIVDGVLVYEGDFVEGELHGEFVVRKDGKVVRKEEWQHGKSRKCRQEIL